MVVWGIHPINKCKGKYPTGDLDCLTIRIVDTKIFSVEKPCRENCACVTARHCIGKTGGAKGVIPQHCSTSREEAYKLYNGLFVDLKEKVKKT